MLNSNLTNLKKSVSDGKSAIASAITAQGVSTASDAAFSVIASNITTAGNNRYNTGYNAGGLKANLQYIDGHRSFSSSSDRYDFEYTMTHTATENCFIITSSIGVGNSSSINRYTCSNGAYALIEHPMDLSGIYNNPMGYIAIFYAPKGSTVSQYFRCLNYSHGGACYMWKLK